jgi:hypothetical protein
MGNLTACKPEEPQETPKVENVGEAFISWAEQNWGLKKLITAGLNASNGGSETCPYEYVREIFVNKINKLSKNKV